MLYLVYLIKNQIVVVNLQPFVNKSVTPGRISFNSLLTCGISGGYDNAVCYIAKSSFPVLNTTHQASFDEMPPWNRP
jgi:hypothetical protein